MPPLASVVPRRRATYLAAALTLLAACTSADAPAGPRATPPRAAPSVAAAKASPGVTVTVAAAGLNNPRGITFGPDGAMYVAEGGVGGDNSTVGQCEQVPSPVGPYTGSTTGARISRFVGGVRTTVADGLPSSGTSPDAGGVLVSGVADVAFVNGQLYGLLTGAGCSHGVPSVPNQVFRVNSNGSWTTVANLSAYYKANPTARTEDDDFEPDGTPFSMIAVRNELYVVEPNHGSLDRVRIDGGISRVADVSARYGHIVPTAVSYHGDFFVGNLNTFPVTPGASRVLKITPSGQMRDWATGLTAVLGTAWDRRDRLYVLESMTAPGAPTPMTGRIVRVEPSGARTVVVDGLFFPTSLRLGPDGALYVSNFGFGPPPVGLGQVLRVQVE